MRGKYKFKCATTSRRPWMSIRRSNPTGGWRPSGRLAHAGQRGGVAYAQARPQVLIGIDTCCCAGRRSWPARACGSGSGAWHPVARGQFDVDAVGFEANGEVAKLCLVVVVRETTVSGIRSPRLCWLSPWSCKVTKIVHIELWQYNVSLIN